MIYIKYYEELNSELAKEIDIIYKDSTLLCMVPKTQRASKIYGNGTEWCQVTKFGFEIWSGLYNRNAFGILIRFIFKNGIYKNKNGRKIRLTYDTVQNNFHWANENGKHIFEQEGCNIFNVKLIKKNSSTEKDVIDLISKIPQECKDKVVSYINSNKNLTASDLYQKNKIAYVSLKEINLNKKIAELIEKYNLSYFLIKVGIKNNLYYIKYFLDPDRFGYEKTNLDLNSFEKEIQIYLSKISIKDIILAKKLNLLNKYKLDLDFNIKINTKGGIVLYVNDDTDVYYFNNTNSCEKKIIELINLTK